MMTLDIGFKLFGITFSYFSIRNPHLRIVRGKNGFVQIGKFAIIWGDK